MIIRPESCTAAVALRAHDYHKMLLMLLMCVKSGRVDTKSIHDNIRGDVR